MPRTDWGWLVTPAELDSWTLLLTPDLFAVNKPGHVLCHPSKFGPWSSLVGAAREFLGEPVLHMPSRLDRETSGAVLFARNRVLGSSLQRAIQHHRVHKTYTAVLDGILSTPITVDQPLGRDPHSAVFLKQAVVPDGSPSQTEFEPLAHAGNHTLVRVRPRTGRLHQIRVHAAFLGHPVTGDKLYGPDETLFLRFIRNGFDETLQRALPLSRQALHASSLVFQLPAGELRIDAPLAADIDAFWHSLQTP
ncbi:MAG: RNA pseudouridine synthase [Acidobacteria bacterium]|nr:RNA pseudouridine synthase [Acidobacteriota bacterium]